MAVGSSLVDFIHPKTPWGAFETIIKGFEWLDSYLHFKKCEKR